MDCVALGDQTAMLVGRKMGCEIRAAVRRTAFDQAAVMRNVRSDLVIISIGDDKPCDGCEDPNLFVDLQYIRSKIVARMVVWILPRRKKAAGVVKLVSDAYKDRVVSLSRP